MCFRSFAIPVVLSLCFCNLVFGNSWVVRFSGGGQEELYAMTVDGSGNVYVTGTRNVDVNGSDYLTVKFDPNGNEVWESGYNGPSNGYDIARAIVADNAGNVYVTGNSPNDVNGDDYLTIKYDPNGDQLWAARYDGPAHQGDYAYAIAVSPAGNVYVTGQSEGSGTGGDYATVKYNPSGVQQWASRYNNSAANNWDAACAIAVDKAGNAYVTGTSTGSTTGTDFLIIKHLNSNGSQTVQRWPTSGTTDEYAYALVIDDSNNVYVTGISDGNYATIKYNSSMTLQWARRYNGDANGYDCPSAIAVDSFGNVYVTGKGDVGDGTCDYATVKYNSGGTQQWVTLYNGPASFDDSANAIAVDASGNVYVTGQSWNTPNWSSVPHSDYATVKYNSSGVEQWAARYNGPGKDFSDIDDAKKVVVDTSGNVYVAGTSNGFGTGADYAIIKNPNEVGYCAGPVVGDLNHDCVVDFGDFGEFASHWLESNLQ
ncbi:MAG: SBBP repeat-containing protein [Sedimentisphaerales bacterium]